MQSAENVTYVYWRTWYFNEFWFRTVSVIGLDVIPVFIKIVTMVKKRKRTIARHEAN